MHTLFLIVNMNRVKSEAKVGFVQYFHPSFIQKKPRASKLLYCSKREPHVAEFTALYGPKQH